jgi:RND superfamily putative drug exporter
MRAIIEVSVRRPRTVLAIWLVLLVALSVAGARIEKQLHLTSPIVPNTTSANTHDLASQLFDHEVTLVVLLTGPEAALNGNGPGIVTALAKIPHVSVVSPWFPLAPKSLHPHPDDAVVLLGTNEPFEAVGKQTVPLARATLARVTPASMGHYVTGYADIGAGIARESFVALKRAELIAAPLLLLILLLVFRGPVAAGIPLLLGFSSLAGARGLLAAINSHLVGLDSSALNLASMFGLALGVDYSLLLVSRFREQLAKGEQPADAARVAGTRAGRTVLTAGVALAAGMIAGYFVAPGRILSSGCIGGLVGVVMAVVGAITILPALLTLLGDRVDRWQLGSYDAGHRLASLAWRMIHHPLLVSGLLTVMLLALASQALSVKVSPPGVGSLPSRSPEFIDLRALSTRLGDGFATPYEVIVHPSEGPINESTLAAMAAWQSRLERDHWVAAVVGPQTVAQIGLARLSEAPPELREALNMGINLDRGSTALRMEVVEQTATSATDFGSRAAVSGDPLRRQLIGEASSVEAEIGASVSVGGPAADLEDFASSSQQRLPVLVAVLSLVTFIVLLIALRSILLALVAVALNVLTVGATLGVLVLGFQRTSALGGGGALDAIVTPAAISVAFGLAIDYEVFLLSRVREGIALTGDTDRGLRYALDRTAGIITGAALVMCGVFVAFASNALLDLREFGVGLAVAVTLDATVVRLVLLPTAVRLLGQRAWWLPRWPAGCSRPR